MRQTDRLKGEIFKLLDRGKHIPYIGSVDITAHTSILDHRSLHIAFAQNGQNKLFVSLCLVTPKLVSYIHTRTLSEINSDKSENPFDHDVFPHKFVKRLTKLGLTKSEYQDLVREAFDLMTLI
jgi:hypothetical protein